MKKINKKWLLPGLALLGIGTIAPIVVSCSNNVVESPTSSIDINNINKNTEFKNAWASFLSYGAYSQLQDKIQELKPEGLISYLNDPENIEFKNEIIANLTCYSNSMSVEQIFILNSLEKNGDRQSYENYYSKFESNNVSPLPSMNIEINQSNQNQIIFKFSSKINQDVRNAIIFYGVMVACNVSWEPISSNNENVETLQFNSKKAEEMWKNYFFSYKTLYETGQMKWKINFIDNYSFSLEYYINNQC